MKEKRKYKYIIFDLDGTLLDTDLYVVSNYAHLYKMFRPGYMPRLAHMVYFSGPTLDEVFDMEFPGIPHDVLLREFVDYSTKHSNEYSTLYDGEVDCLEHLKKEGYKISVVTSKRLSSVMNNFKHFGLEKYFDHLVCYDHVSKKKPDPEGINKCIELYGAKPSEVLYIGDSATDLEAGKRAGVDIALVKWGLKTVESTITPNFIFTSYNEIKEKL